ncbi:MAG: Tyrosine recombinase XerC [Burkholderia lata]|uniref:Tyrosine recombinase XerC n=1 Tax=Burkholderia lata (strain ATCC 17760 / DSM 23089 / LMG 22485 / NCIMB 9086 / R18194 / 383) TaxID=482957 RepID=A0A833PPS0_BURL3|nr:tyrosine-type recombinase/integrase [Burkholderia lata]KAF1037009.1 MAG: Tyrosine recombinase XerC [Burkholderia lata]
MGSETHEQLAVKFFRPQLDFGSWAVVREHAGLAEAVEWEPRLFALPLVAVIVDAADVPVWMPTLFLADIALASLSVTGDTVRTYAEALLVWLRYIEARKMFLTDVTEETIGVYRAELSSQKNGSQRRYASATINQRVVVAVAFHEWGHRRNLMPSPLGKYLCSADPDTPWRAAGRSRSPRGPRLPRIGLLRVIKRLPVALSEDEICRLFLVTPMPYRLMLKWSVATGVRRFEVCDLRIGDLPSPARLESSRSGFAELTLLRKGAREVTVYAPARLVEETRWYVLTERKSSDMGDASHVFLNAAGRNVSRQTLTRIFRKSASSIGSDATLHHLRHTFATHVLSFLEQRASAGEELNSLKVLQVLLGHSQIETTEIYTQAYQISGDAVVAALDFLYGAAS